MPKLQTPPPLPKTQPPFLRRYSTILKLLGVGALTLILLIPLGMITGVLNDRLSRRNEAVTEITSSWGKRPGDYRAGFGYPLRVSLQDDQGSPRERWKGGPP